MTDPRTARRARYLDRLDGAAALLFGGVHAVRNSDSEYRYRPHSDVVYLTGWEEPEVAALFRPGSDQPFVLFVLPKDRERETWTGRRGGVEAARAKYGADLAFPYSELAARLPVLLQGYDRLHYAYGESAEHDKTVFGAIANARGPLRNGTCLPWKIEHSRVLLGELRLTKDDTELAALRRAAAITTEAHLAAMRTGRAGAYEYEVEAAIDGTFRRLGGTGAGYTTIVGGGDNACVLHYIENRAELRPGSLCLVDAGAEFDWYTADVTRTWPVSGRFTGPQRDVYAIVLEAQLAAIARAEAGRPFREMHDAAVAVLTRGMVELGLLDGDVDELIVEERYRKYYMHGTGHWLGLDVHDAGAYHVGMGSRKLEPGQVVTVEPGLYIASDDEDAPAALRGIGVRIEDDVLITAGGPDILTAACPKTLRAVEAACAR